MICNFYIYIYFYNIYMIENDLTDLHRFMAFDSWYCRHRMTLIFTFRYSNHRVVLHFFIVWRYAVFLTFKISPLGLDPRRPRPREIPNGRMPWFPFWSLDWIGPESEPCSARKKRRKTRKTLQCNAWHLCAKALASWHSDWNSLMILIYLKMLSVFLQNEREDATWNFRSQRSHVESIHFMWRFFRFGLHDQAALQPLWRRCHNTLWE
jgi:hypothetical protein